MFGQHERFDLQLSSRERSQVAELKPNIIPINISIMVLMVTADRFGLILRLRNTFELLEILK